MLEQNTDIRLPSLARACQARHHRALRAGGHQRDPRGDKPIKSPHSASAQQRAAGITAGEHVPSCSGGRGHLPRLRLRGSNTGHVSLAQLKVMSAIESCRTAALGGHVASCENCSYTTIAYNSCRNRHCPKRQGAVAREWMAAREAQLLPVPYFQIVFTLPSGNWRLRLPEQDGHL